ncbi:Mbeg1-like protein [Bifidobacterium aquikefiri]|mgnify:CR=1 FL=1|uniref:PGAP1-like alpha/beta domain-containing protein n=1 Tax=Bifidobacterium aquikefiri TaxID=1653207 RepID=UPI0023F029FB|nr:Mbeg1-like protein [Bifidobacterium aquikefiri]
MAALIARAHSLYSQAEQTTLRLLTGLMAGSAVAFLANGLSACTAMISALAQGNRLHVLPVDGTALPAVTSTEGALTNLQLLASNGDYATIAIQQYVNEQGKRSWLVTIPGTDSHIDSPIGWLQNMELMSDNSSTRLQADSVRFVLDAMRQAGIERSENVMLVGHSQGGIVAATIAADMAEEYQIAHVITAGSPVANHPIPGNTWVTSIEVEADVVPDLDGRHNPSRQTWLTVRAQEAKKQSKSKSGEQQESNQRSAGTAEQSHDKAVSEPSKSESHTMRKQQEAWRDALYLGSPAVELHDAHIREIMAGTLESTQYYQGRLHTSETATTPTPEPQD